MIKMNNDDFATSYVHNSVGYVCAVMEGTIGGGTTADEGSTFDADADRSRLMAPPKFNNSLVSSSSSWTLRWSFLKSSNNSGEQELSLSSKTSENEIFN